MRFGILLIIFSFFILAYNIFPVVKTEFKLKSSKLPVQSIVSESPKDFSIVVPRYKIKAPVSANVDPFDTKAYQLALNKGAAHAKGSSLPGQNGKIFIFAHSSSDLLSKNPYGTLFYPLTDLNAGDEVVLDYNGKQYSYKVRSKFIVDPKDITPLDKTDGGTVVYLMTCWPPGTSLKRMIITADPTPLLQT